MKRLAIVLFILIVSIIFNSPAYTQIQASKSLDRFYDPIEIKAGGLLNSMLNLELERFGLLAYREGKLDFISYQVDEWTGKKEMVLRLGENNNAKEGNGKLDPQDMLVFMARDVGDRVASAEWQKLGSPGVEIEVRDPLTKKEGWVYLVYCSNAIPPKGKILLHGEVGPPPKLSGANYTIVGSHIKVGKKYYSTVVNRDISVTPIAGGNGKNFIDRCKIRTSLSLLFGVINITLNEDVWIGGVSRYAEGPVRAMALQWVALTLPMHLRSPRAYGSVYMYDTMVLIPAQVHVPFNPGYVITNFKQTIGYDLHNPNGRGLKYYSDTNPQGLVVDGHMDKDELKFNEAPDKWRCIVGPQGWMVHRSLWDEAYRRQAEIKMKYIDDVKHLSPPDYFPGDLGYYYTESTIQSLESRTYNMQLDFYFPNYLYTPQGPDLNIINAICNIRDNPLKISVENKEVDNRGGLMTPLIP